MITAISTRARASCRASQGDPMHAMAVLFACLSLAVSGAARSDEGDSTPVLTEVVVVGVLRDNGVPLDEIPANVQRVDASLLGRGKSDDLADALNRFAGSIGVNDTQGNPFQPDVAFRGFAASPVLGTPQGVSVFVDGVRVNEAFGDAVNWDLIPAAAIASIEVIPGSDPVFGLNTLGGALTVTTKRGFSQPGTTIEGSLGSFGRRALEAETGGHGEHVDFFVTGNAFDDDGWADHNPSRIRQGYGKLGYRTDATDIELSATLADNRLEGNQTLPRSMWQDPYQAYSWPDAQTDRMTFVDLGVTHHLGNWGVLAGNAYYREVRTDVANSNVNEGFDPTLAIGPGNEPTGNVVEHIAQYRPGATIQLTRAGAIGGRRNTLVVGASYDQGLTNFSQYRQDAGSSRDTTSNAPLVVGTLLHAVNRYSGLYFTDTLGISDRLFVTAAGRYNRATVTLEDRLGTALNGEHRFIRFNPAFGLAFNPSPRATVYISYGEGMRVPTPVELTCADPNAPCSLPNAFSADPPLKAVVAHTVELGARGTFRGGADFSAALFSTALTDDIQFVSSGGGATSSGFFENVGQTRRQGLELAINARRGMIGTSIHYTYLEATYRTALVLSSPDNSSAAALACAACADIQVRPGDRIPGLPRQVAKLRLEYAPSRFTIGLNAIAQSGQYARGDENNRDRNGPLPGFVVVNADLRYDLSARWHAFARIDNLLDRRYSTFGLLGQNVFTGPAGAFDPTGSSWRSEQFRSFAAPRGIWLGLEMSSRPGAGGS